jgi:hypothetical protein
VAGNAATAAEHFIIGVGSDNKYRISHIFRSIKTLKSAMTHRAFQ